MDYHGGFLRKPTGVYYVVDGDIQHMLTFMRDLHRYTARKLGDERILAIKYALLYLRKGRDMKLAQYGIKNTGALRRSIAKGLKNRYGALMQTISGVHYNFSLPMAVLARRNARRYGRRSGKRKISAGCFV